MNTWILVAFLAVVWALIMIGLTRVKPADKTPRPQPHACTHGCPCTGRCPARWTGPRREDGLSYRCVREDGHDGDHVTFDRAGAFVGGTTWTGAEVDAR